MTSLSRCIHVSDGETMESMRDMMENHDGQRWRVVYSCNVGHCGTPFSHTFHDFNLTARTHVNNNNVNE